MSNSDELLKDWLVQTLKQSNDFVIAQAPDIVQQYLMSNLIEAISMGVLSVFFFVVSIFAIRWALQSKERDDELRPLTIGISILAIGISSIVLMIAVPISLKIIYAPKGFLLEKILSR